MRIPLAAALVLAACAHAPPMDAPAALAAAEAAFAAHSVRADMRAAFLAHFAADGVFVRDGWTNSNRYLRGRAAPPITLDWRAQYVEVAASGDLGLSTGPWKITSRADPAAPAAYGQFVSIWRRGRDGRWQVEADLGIAHPQPWLWDAALESRTTPAAAAGGGSLAAAEEAFARAAARDGARAAYAAFGAGDLRYYRNGHPPRADRAVTLATGAVGDQRLAWTVERLETAGSGDFGYARGRFAAASAPARTLGWYLRAWRREDAGWRIVLDVANPAPAP